MQPIALPSLLLPSCLRSADGGCPDPASKGFQLTVTADVPAWSVWRVYWGCLCRKEGRCRRMPTTISPPFLRYYIIVRVKGAAPFPSASLVLNVMTGTPGSWMDPLPIASLPYSSATSAVGQDSLRHCCATCRQALPCTPRHVQARLTTTASVVCCRSGFNSATFQTSRSPPAACPLGVILLSQVSILSSTCPYAFSNFTAVSEYALCIGGAMLHCNGAAPGR